MPASKQPPAPMPPVEALYAVTRSYEWLNLWRYVVCQPALKHTGLAVASFSDKRGMDIYPGLRRTMLVTGLGKTATIEALKHLRWLGFLWRVSSGKGRDSREADKYMLCRPKTLDHLPMVIKKPLRDPTFEEMSLAARKTAVVLNVHERLKGGGPLTEPGVVHLANHPWWSERTTPTHVNHPYDLSAQLAAERASSPGRVFDLSDFDGCFNYVVDQVRAATNDELNPAQVAAIEGMLRKEDPLPLIINTVKSLHAGKAA